MFRKIAENPQFCEKLVKIYKKRKITPNGAKYVIFIKKVIENICIIKK